MPIKIPNNLPGRKILEKERVPLIKEKDAVRQDIRPLRIVLLNLMPTKIQTETQFLRALGATPLQIEVTLLHMSSHDSKNTSKDHLMEFYVSLDEIKNEKYDGLIVTGAPIEHLEYKDVSYWGELTEVFDWAKSNIHSSFFVCWGAQAALNYYHGIPKYTTKEKQFGIFNHRVLKPFEPLISGFDDHFEVPVARNTEVRREDIVKIPSLDILVESDETGICLLQETTQNRFYMFNHLEYDADTMVQEYIRDRDSGFCLTLPYNYFPDNDPTQQPKITWRAHRSLLFRNWINLIYQTTPYDLEKIKK